MDKDIKKAPGHPGAAPSWTTGAKSGIGKAISGGSDVCFTLGQGVINEVYFPREDIVCIRQMGLIVTDGKDFYADEKFDSQHEVELPGNGIPDYIVTNTCNHEKFVIRKEIITDPIRNTLLQSISFKPLQHKNADFRLYVVLEPHIRNKGGENTGWKGNYKGVPMLFAERENIVLAMACSQPWKKRTAGFKESSDGRTDLEKNKQLTCEYDLAEKGNITLTAEIDWHNKQNVPIVIAVGFGYSDKEAGQQAWSSLLEGFNTAKKKYVNEWMQWQSQLSDERSDNNTIGKYFRSSAAVLRICESKMFPGGMIASMSIPWGNARSDDDLGGYHLVWPRDLVETAWALLALKSDEDVLRIVNYLMSTQQEDGSWIQNMWLEGAPYWTGIQMDQTALPVILMDACYHRNLLDKERLKKYWECIKKAASYILINGPATEQDRWERQSGISPFTIATEIAALLVVAEFAEMFGYKEMAGYCRDTADCWNENIELWTYVTGNKLALENNVDGYYIRVNPSIAPINEAANSTYLDIKHHDGGEGKSLATEIIATDALALVRFGLRGADDPKILNTLKLIDKYLKVETPSGPCWHRFTKDAYGEDENGNPFKKAGKGRAWPLLTGERAHYEVAAGNIEEAKKLLKAMEAFSNYGMIPEQVWDTNDIPEKGMCFGKHTGSAMPLVWAHAEYIKLCNSIKHYKIVDLPSHTFDRYVKNKKSAKYTPWRFNMQSQQVTRDTLRIEVKAPFLVKWTSDNWQHENQNIAKDTQTGMYIADIPVNMQDEEIIFTFFWTEASKWEGKNYFVQVRR